MQLTNAQPWLFMRQMPDRGKDRHEIESQQLSIKIAHVRKHESSVVQHR